MVEKFVGEVGRMTHEQDRLVGTVADEGWNRPIRVGMALHGIVKSREPKPSGITLKGNACISEDDDAAGGERLGYRMRADGDIVVAEDRIALRALETFEDPGAFPRVGYGPFAGQQLVCHEIAC